MSFESQPQKTVHELMAMSPVDLIGWANYRSIDGDELDKAYAELKKLDTLVRHHPESEEAKKIADEFGQHGQVDWLLNNIERRMNLLVSFLTKDRAMKIDEELEKTSE